MARAKIYQGDLYMGTPIQKFKEGSREEILSAIRKIFQFMWDHCGKRLFVCHFTVHLKETFKENGNEIVRGALHSWRTAWNHKKIHAEYLWCREEGLHSYNSHPHYHIFLLVPGKYIQSGYGICTDLNRLISIRTGEDSKKVHINPPQSDGFRWGKKVSEKLGNYDDAILWASYLAKIETKNAPYRQRTYSYSKGFLRTGSVSTIYTQEDLERFENFDPKISSEDWDIWGPENFDPESELNFDPQTGGEHHKQQKKALSSAQSIREGFHPGSAIQ